MSKFLLKKKFSLAFLGEEWKKGGAYINLEAVTIADIKTKFPKFKIDEKDDAAVLQGMVDILDFLKAKFISGKGVGEDGSLIDLKAEDLESLPAEVLSRALSFLSAGVNPPTSVK